VTAVCEICSKEEAGVTNEEDTAVLGEVCLEQEFLSWVSGEEAKFVKVYANFYWSLGRGGGAHRGH
jgi:hypothetical protein